MMLADVEENIEVNREQLERHKETYENFARQVEAGQARVLAARQKPRSWVWSLSKASGKRKWPVSPVIFLSIRTA